MQQVNVMIVEDEAIVALDLSAGLENDGYNVIGPADNMDDAVSLFTQNDVDIVLMDIHIMGNHDGIETAVELLKHRQVPVIYLTAFTDSATVNRVKQTHPAAFLTKPYNIQNVRIAIELAINNFAVARSGNNGKVVPMAKADKEPGDKEQILQMRDFIFVKHNYHFIKLALSELLYIEADNNYVNLITADRKLAVRLSLNQLLEKIHYKQLVRIHRSYAINMDTIQSFNEHQVIINKAELPIGRNYREEFLRRFDFT